MGVTIKRLASKAVEIGHLSPYEVCVIHGIEKGKAVNGQGKPANIIQFPTPAGNLGDQLASIAAPAKATAFHPTVTPSKFVRDECKNNPEYRERYLQALRDLASLPKMKLYQARYKVEYDAFRHEKNHAKLDTRLHDFRNWLAHLGPRPHEGFSVDRIDPRKGYAISNVRWASKVTQTENRRLTKWHRLPDGRSMTVTQLAAYLDQKPDTIRKALSRGKAVQDLLDRYGAHEGEHTWDFPPAMPQLEPEYKAKRKAGQSRLNWFLHAAPRLLEDLERLGTSLAARAPLLDAYREAKTEKERFAYVKKTEQHKLALSLIGKTLPAPLPTFNPPKDLLTALPLTKQEAEDQEITLKELLAMKPWMKPPKTNLCS